MNKRAVFHHLLGILFAISSIILGISDALAVVKHVNVVGGDGHPLKYAPITIELPDGTAVGESKTDARGILKFDFPDAGEYMLKDADGNVLKTLKVTKVGTGTWVLAELGLGAAVLVASNDNIFGSGASVVSGGGGGGGGTVTSPVNGTYQVSFSLATGETPGGPLDLLTSVNIIVAAQAPLTITQITADPNFGDVTGTLNNTTFDFSAIGAGTYNNINTQFSMQGTFNVSPLQTRVTGTYTIGADGSLPNAQVIVYNFDGVAF